MTAQVYIILAEAKNALTVPAAALQSSNRPQRANKSANSASGANSTRSASAPQGQANKNGQNAADRPERLELTADEKTLIDQGKASVSIVRVLKADGSAQRKQVLIGLNNRVTAQVLRGLNEGDQVVLADGSDTSNDSAKRSNKNSGPMRL